MIRSLKKKIRLKRSSSVTIIVKKDRMAFAGRGIFYKNDIYVLKGSKK